MEPLDVETAPELAVIRGTLRLQIKDCSQEEVRLARLLYEPWASETLEQAYPTERSIALKQARMAIAFTKRLADASRDHPNGLDTWDF
jgi:hypothetical protein